MSTHENSGLEQLGRLLSCSADELETTYEYLTTFTDKKELCEYLEELVSSSTHQRDVQQASIASFTEQMFQNRSNTKPKTIQVKKGKSTKDQTSKQQKEIKPFENTTPTKEVWTPTFLIQPELKKVSPKTEEPLIQDTQSIRQPNFGSKYTYVPSQKSRTPLEMAFAQPSHNDDFEFPELSESKPKNSKKIVNNGDLCLSMHQPYASLLVAGIKTVEGRGWYSEVRGPLWIAAASKVPTREEITSVEQQYKGTKKKFPTEYPCSALLGQIYVEDMLTQEEYRAKVPEKDQEENGSQYLFTYKNPQRLAMPLQISGQHKIWKLDRKIVEAAKKRCGPLMMNTFEFKWHNKFILESLCCQEEQVPYSQKVLNYFCSSEL